VLPAVEYAIGSVARTGRRLTTVRVNACVAFGGTPFDAVIVRL